MGRNKNVIIEGAIDILCSPQDVFDYCTDLTTEREWILEVVSRCDPLRPEARSMVVIKRRAGRDE
jgi:hypothetical protein